MTQDEKELIEFITKVANAAEIIQQISNAVEFGRILFTQQQTKSHEESLNEIFNDLMKRAPLRLQLAYAPPNDEEMKKYMEWRKNRP